MTFSGCANWERLDGSVGASQRARSELVARISCQAAASIAGSASGSGSRRGARRGGRRRELKRRGVRRLGGVRLGRSDPREKRSRSGSERARADPRNKSLPGRTRLPRGRPSTTRGRAFFALIRSAFFAARPEVERQIGERVHRGCRFFSLRRREGRKRTRVARSEPPETKKEVGGKFAVDGGVLAERRRRAERLGRRV